MAVNEAVKKVEEYKNQLIKKAEDLVGNGFPNKVLELNAILATPAFNRQELSVVHFDLNVPIPDPLILNSHSSEDHMGGPGKKRRMDDEVQGTRVMILPSGKVPCNKHICDMVHIVKPHIRQLVEDANLLKMWISFLIPKIEDGNNFGVSIQEDTLAEIQSVESEAAAFLDQISRYFISRAKIVSKVAKYPHIEDYRRSVQEVDEKEYVSLWLALCEVRNRYSSLHDVVTKNMEKIKRPRSSNADNMY